MSGIFVILGAVLAIVILLLTVKWPQVGISFSLVGIMFGTIIVRYIGLQSGITASLFGLLLFGTVVFAVKNKVKLFSFTPQEWILFALVLYMFIGMRSTPTPIYGKYKVLRFVASCVVLMVSCRVLGMTRDNLSRSLRVFAWISSAVLIMYTLLFVFARGALMAEGRFSGGTSPLLLSWSTSTAIVLASYLLISKSMPWTKVFVAFTLLMGVTVIMASGSRGPFVALMGGTIASFIGRKAFMRSLFILAVIGVIFYVAFTFLTPEEGKKRVSTITQKGAAYRSGRVELSLAGLRWYKANFLFGGGPGSFALYVGSGDERDYPHNMFIEVACENGTLGLGLLLMMLAYCIKPFLMLRSRAEPLFAEAKILQWLFWIGLGNAMVSFDITDQRILFAAIGFLAAVRQWVNVDEYQYYQLEVQGYLEDEQTFFYNEQLLSTYDG